MAEKWNRIMKKDFLDFLEGPETILQFRDRGEYHTYVKVPYNSAVSVLYHGYRFVRDGEVPGEILSDLSRSNALDFSGFYSAATRTLYEAIWIDDVFQFPVISFEDLQEEICSKVSERVSCHVAEHPEEFRTEASAEDIEKGAHARAVRVFFAGQEAIALQPSIQPPVELDYHGIAAYVSGPASYVETAANDYINTHRPALALRLAEVEAAGPVLLRMRADPNCGPARRLAIKEAVEGCVTVFVSIIKDGVQLCFRTKAESLRCLYGGPYRLSDIERPWRQEYGRRLADKPYDEFDIVRITHGNRLLYERRAAAEEENSEV